MYISVGFPKFEINQYGFFQEGASFWKFELMTSDGSFTKSSYLPTFEVCG
jgi:hypothetical protein